MFKAEDVKSIGTYVAIAVSKENEKEYNVLWNSIPPNSRFFVRDLFSGRSCFLLDQAYVINKLAELTEENSELHSRIYSAKLALSSNPGDDESVDKYDDDL